MESRNLHSTLVLLKEYQELASLLAIQYLHSTLVLLKV